MTTTINAVASTGLVQTSDGSGIIKVQSNGVTTNALAWGSYAFVASGSVPTLRSAYNISSITRNSAGNFTFAFTNALSDANYAAFCSVTYSSFGSATTTPSAKSTTSVTFLTGYVASGGGAATGFDYGVDLAIFGN